MSQLVDRIANLSPRKRALLALRLQAQQESESKAKTEPIAVVGIGCRFPGNVNSADEFWQALVNGVDAVDDIPADRWDVDSYYDPAPATPGKMNTRWGGFINDIDKFDAAFFGISPREADSLDPQQRVLLEVTWEALEHAGQATDKLSGSQTGVFIGICRNDYGQLHGVTEEPARIDPYFGTGNTSCFATGRISYLLGLHGPSLAVDTACSSSLVAVHLACRSLRAGECRMALAGGVNLILSPWPDIYMSQLRTLAPDGRCKAFDDRADGYVRGEGCGVVVLKRLSDALADNDNVLVVIRGSAVNQDGRSAGLTAPNGPAQEAVIRSALTDARMDPREVSFVEAHGTGTSLGDPIEIRALAAVFDEGRDGPLMVGSVKSNLGHLEAAAGVAGFIKAVLTVQHGEITKQLHFSEPSSYIPWKDVRVAIPRETMPWPLDQVDQARRAGAVSSFGFSGTNAHVLVEEWREEATVSGERDDVYVLPLSARDGLALRELAARYVQLLESADEATLRDLCYSASVRRAHHRQRVAVVGRSAGELRAQLEAFLSSEAAPGVFAGKGAGRSGVVYVFSGQGAQWWGMGRELAARYPEFRASLAECDELFAQRTQEWRLLEELERGPEESRLDGEEMDLTQCALFALQVSLARLWSAYAVRPTAVVGHSMGEVAAAVAAGVLSLAEGVAVIYERSRLLKQASGRGAMAAVELSEEEAEAVVAGTPVGVAAMNGKRACVVSGEREAVQRLMRELEAKSVMVREVRTSGVAAHSPQVAHLGEELMRVLGGIRGRASEVRLVSTVSGRGVAGEEIDATYWGRNLRQQVRFRAAMQELAHSGDAVYIEMSAHPVLGLYIREALEEANNKPATVVAALRRERSEMEVTLTGLAELYAAGVSINWEAVWRGRTARYVSLPAYPWQRRRFWIEPRTQSQIFTEGDVENDSQQNRLVESLIKKWGREGVLAVNRRYLAPFIFLSKTQQSLFYFNLKSRSIVALMYVGPDDQYGPLVKELREYCQSKRFQLNLIATESGTPALKELGFSTTPCGALQSITDLKNFTLDGNRMRRLRYLVQRYQPGGSVKEYQAGSDPNVDDDICNLIDNWIETRKKRVPFSATLKDDIRSGRLDPRLRLFLTYSDQRLDSAVVISPAVATNGYLLDLEFYREDGAQGCLEFTIVEIIRTLANEGREYLSLGGSFGTQLNPHANADAQVEQLFATLHDEQILNGDGNFQFKSKFRPEMSQLYLCLPKDSEHAGLADVLTTLAGDGASEEDLKQLSARLKSEAPDTKQRRSNRSLHPLLGEKLHLALNEEVFQSYQSIASLSFLSDHAVGGIVVMPGTAYIEMGLAAAQHALGPGAHSIVDLSLQQVMAFPQPNTERPDTETIVQLTLKREDNGASFRILSAPAEADSGQWLLHATGTIRSQATAPVETALEAIRSRCTEEITGEAFYDLLRRNGLEYGPSFQGVKHVWRRDREALGQVQLPESQSGELRNYRIHPALLDACFQVFEATIDTAAATDDAIYLLRGVEAIEVYGELPRRVWAHAVLRDSDNRDLYAGDLMLYGESERPVVQVKGIYAKRAKRSSLVRNTQKHLSDWLYEIRWQLSTAAEYDAAEIQPRAWVIFCDDGEFGKNLEATLRSHGQQCLLVHPDKDYDRVLNEAALASPGLPLGIVFFSTSDENELESIELGCRSVLNLIRSVIDTNLTGSRLWLVTRGAQSIGTETVAPAQSALWGMGRVIAAEYPETFGGLIDLDASTTPSADAVLREVVREILRPADGEDQIVYRAGQRYVARLVRSTTAKNDPVRFKESATYLITGGLGGLGFECAGWMIERGAKHIALASRRPASDEQQTKISQWQKQGATIRVFQTDVTNEEQIKDLITGIEQSMPPLKGIIHAAGVVEDGMAHKQSWEQFQRVVDPKVRGAYALHLCTRHLSLDFFTLFSSAASMFGSVGQINHAAANAFLDGLAHQRKAQGLAALSINWGAWSEIGEAAKQNVPEKLAARGIDAIEPEQGWQVFEMIFNHPSAQVGVVPIDWQRWQRLYRGRVPPLVAQLMQQSQPATPIGQARRDLIESFFATEPNKQQEKIEAYLVQQAARVLRMDPSSLDLQRPLSDFGLDSIMTVELRDRIDAEWQVRVPLVEFFREPTIARLSSIMLEQLRSLTPTQQSSPTDPVELLNRLDQMSETEMDKLLDVMLAEQDAAQSETAVASA